MNPGVERYALMFGTFLNLLLLLTYLQDINWAAAPTVVAGTLAQVVLAYISAVIG